MANGKLALPDRIDKQFAERHPDCILIIATNTWGRGGTTEYSARETIDAATRDRFALSKVWVDYAYGIESRFLGHFNGQPTFSTWSLVSSPAKPLQQVFADLRANIKKHGLRRVLSTRAFQQAAALRKAGFNDAEIISRFFVDWTEQERVKALEGVL
jgi:MoxR-like ATPase